MLKFYLATPISASLVSVHVLLLLVELLKTNQLVILRYLKWRWISLDASKTFPWSKNKWWHEIRFPEVVCSVPKKQLLSLFVVVESYTEKNYAYFLQIKNYLTLYKMALKFSTKGHI